ncbi:Transmembrane protein of unknown function [Paraoerskovia marina]|uniref:DUF3566 domain-containing protein n=1 Tax=Paraoerskovia marina TaxID=545619 RepID=A0A1H1N637_9CELL|nr:DUF3566 domain-containing protein [Paraoerskovia marina]SDR94503.1 Transmembrane protein of unknown function [Paraoerskovia marina]
MTTNDRLKTDTPPPPPEPKDTAKDADLPFDQDESVERPGSTTTPPGPPATTEQPTVPASSATAGVKSSAAKAAAAAMSVARSARDRVASATAEAQAARQERYGQRENATASSGAQEAPQGASAGAEGTSAMPGGEQPASSQQWSAAGTTGTATATAPAAVDGSVRRVRLVVSRVDPWSVMKLAFLMSFALGILWVVATAMFWSTLDGLGVFTEIDGLVQSIVGEENPVDVLQYVAFDRALSLAALIAIVNLVLLTAIATIFAFIYNLVAAAVGGIHVTLTDE